LAEIFIATPKIKTGYCCSRTTRECEAEGTINLIALERTRKTHLMAGSKTNNEYENLEK
jgi:hypothetical protein